MKNFGNHGVLASIYTPLLCQLHQSFGLYRRNTNRWLIRHIVFSLRARTSKFGLFCMAWIQENESCSWLLSFAVHLFLHSVVISCVIWNHQFLPEFPLAALRQTSRSLGCGYLKFRVCKWQSRESSANMSKVATLSVFDWKWPEAFEKRSVTSFVFACSKKCVCKYGILQVVNLPSTLDSMVSRFEYMHLMEFECCPCRHMDV